MRMMKKPERQSGAVGRNRPNPPLVRSIIWIASSKDDLSALPRDVKASFGSRLYELQQGKTPLDMKPLPQFGAGVYELRESFEQNAHRVMYVVNLRKALYVLRLHETIQVRDRPAEAGC